MERCSFGWRLIVALVWVTLLSAPAVAQEALAETVKSSAVVSAEVPVSPTPLTEPLRDYWPLLVAGIGVAAGGRGGAHLAYLEAERWKGMPLGMANRQRRIDVWNTWTVAGSIAATVGVGLIVLWGTIQLSQASATPSRPYE